MLTTEEIAKANAAGAAMRASTPHAVAARYDRKADRMVLTLSSKVELIFAPKDAEGLEEATPAQLSMIEISPSGFGIHFPKIDADLYVPGLLEGALGSRKWMAARANGSLGGRPRGVVVR